MRWFRLRLREDILRKLTRKEYYEVVSWLRSCERVIERETKWE